MVGNVVSRRYAKALVEIVRQDDRLDQTAEELKKVNSVITGEPGIRSFLNNPAFNVTMKLEILEDIIQRVEVSEITAKFLRLLLEKDRLRFFETVLFFYEELSYKIQNRLKADLVSASSLTDTQRDEIAHKLSEITGKQVELTLNTDPDLIAGFIASVGSTVYDGSLKNQLSMIKNELLQI